MADSPDQELHCCTKRRKVTGSGNPTLPNWSELQPELLELILGKLPAFVDVLRFRSVCPAWNLTTKSYISNPHRSSTLLQTPWLMVPSEQDDDDDTRCFYNLAEKKVYIIKNMFKAFDHDPRCVGSLHGWLVIWTKKAILHLFNPISQARIELPSITTLPPTDIVLDFNLFECPIAKAVLSTDPSYNKNYFIVAMYTTGRERLALYKHGDYTWNHLGSPHQDYRDIMFHNNHLFVWSSNEMEVWDFGAAYPIKTMDFRLSSEEDRALYRSFTLNRRWRLVESFGELLRVEQLHNICRGEWHFYVFRLNFSSKKWEKMERLEDRALCLGDEHSIMSISTRDLPEFEENSIYFINEDKEDHESAGMYDIVQVYNLEKKTVKSCYKYRLNSECFAPPVFWIVLNPST